MALAKDPSSDGGRARRFDKGPCGDILYASNFGENHFDGWRPAHFNGFAATPPCGLTSYPTHSGKLALQLSTEMRHYASTNQGLSCVTFRSISLYGVRRYLSYSAFLALGVGGYTDGWESFGIYYDIQKQDDSSRSFPMLQVIARAAVDGHTQARIINDNAVSHPVIPNSSHCWTGDNENKQNWGYLRLTWDLQANGGLGGYQEAQVQNQVFDLTGLGGGSAAFAPQTATSEGGAEIGQYSGGFNIGIYVNRSTVAGQEDTYPMTLAADSIVLSTHD